MRSVTSPLETRLLRLFILVAQEPHRDRLLDAVFLDLSQVAASGFQACPASWLGVSFGVTAPALAQRSSIGPSCSRSPCDFTRTGAAPSPKTKSMTHSLARGSASRHSMVGGTKSGGKTEPAAG
jgi:hypothetical protein